jgi:hypothetical protein
MSSAFWATKHGNSVVPQFSEQWNESDLVSDSVSEGGCIIIVQNREE